MHIMVFHVCLFVTYLFFCAWMVFPGYKPNSSTWYSITYYINLQLDNQWAQLVTKSRNPTTKHWLINAHLFSFINLRYIKCRVQSLSPTFGIEFPSPIVINNHLQTHQMKKAKCKRRLQWFYSVHTRNTQLLVQNTHNTLGMVSRHPMP